MATREIVDPGLDNAVDGGIDHVTYRTLIMVMTTLMAVQTRAGGSSGQCCEQDEGVLELHCVLYRVYRRTVVVIVVVGDEVDAPGTQVSKKVDKE